MNQFASGPKKSYYGKGDVIAYRLHRTGTAPAGQSPVFGVNAKILIYGESFWPTYTTGDNTGLVATDSMKNFIQRETMNFPGNDLESYCHFLGDKFLNLYPQAEGAQISATEIPYENIPGTSVSYAPAGPERAFARFELGQGGVWHETGTDDAQRCQQILTEVERALYPVRDGGGDFRQRPGIEPQQEEGREEGDEEQQSK